MFDSILSSQLSSSLAMLLCIFVSLLCGLVISLVYKKTGPTSQNFLITLVLLPALVCLVIMLVNGNLGASVAIVGAFSLVRFRSIPGSSKDILGVFFAMSIGLATGMGYVTFAFIASVLLSMVILLLYCTNFGMTISNRRHLRITIPEDLNYVDAFTDLFKNYTSYYRLTKTKTTNLGSLFEITYDIELKNKVNEKSFIDELRIRNGNLPIVLSEVKAVDNAL